MTVDEDLEARAERRHALACELVRRLPWGSDYMDHMRPYEPRRLVPQARRAIRGLDGAEPPTAARQLADACTILLQLVEEARYPLWAEGHEQADYYRDEPEELVSLVNDEDVLALRPRTLYGRIRRAVDRLPELVTALEADFAVVARNGYRRTVAYPKVEAVTDAAGDTALLCALLAVELDPAIARAGDRHEGSP